MHVIFRLRNLYLTLLSLLFLLASSVNAQEPFKIYGKVIVDDGNLSGAKITIEKNGVRVKVNEVSKSKFEFPLDYDAEYLFSFSKDGYITKRVMVNTSVPKEKQSLEFEPFKFDVEIFKQYQGVNTVIYNQPVGKIRFNDVLNEFDYDTDYTKSIQAELSKAEAAIKEKFKEEQKQKELEAKQKPAQVQVGTEVKVNANINVGTQVGVDISKANGEGNKPKFNISEPKTSTIVGKTLPSAGNTLTGIVTMKSYTAAEYGNPNMKYYGWINYGDNTGIHEIATREEYEELYRKYGQQ